jgi:cell division septum initiation protein DivIVA
MSETAPGTTELTSQYSNQVADDLERNLKEQERLSGEIEALQGQLAALRQDHAVLLNIQQVLGTPTPADSPSTPPGAVVPAPRKKAAAPDERTGTRKSTARAGKQTGKQTEKKTGKKAAAKASTVPSGATLVDLVREHLAGQREPRSAAEICTALGGAYPERTIKTTVVRTTLEGLVARNQAQRTKQGSSVFYTSPDASEAAAQTEDGSQQTD